MFELRISRSWVWGWSAAAAAGLLGAGVWLYPDVGTPAAIALTAFAALQPRSRLTVG